MALDTNTEVEQIRKVQNEEGDQVSPATEKRQIEIADAVGNRAGVAAGRNEPLNADPTNLSDVPVPEGVGVLVQCHTDNDEPIHVGNEDEQPVTLLPNQSIVLPVANLSDVWFRCPGSGDAAAWIVVGGDA